MSRVSGRVFQDRKMSKKGRDYKPRRTRQNGIAIFYSYHEPVAVCRAISYTFQIHISKCHFHLIRASFQKIHFSNWITKIENTFVPISNRFNRIVENFARILFTHVETILLVERGSTPLFLSIDLMKIYVYVISYKKFDKE